MSSFFTNFFSVACNGKKKLSPRNNIWGVVKGGKLSCKFNTKITQSTIQ